MVDVPWDGSYPWRPSGVSRTFPNGDTFVVQINDPNALDGGNAVGKASHTYDSHSFDCYPSHAKDLYKLDDGTMCSSAYICYHNDEPTTPTPPQAEPTLKYNAYKEKVNLTGKWSAQDIFSLAKTASDDYCDEEKPARLSGTSVSGSGDCTVKFKRGPNYASQMVEAMQKIVESSKESLDHFDQQIDPPCLDLDRVCNQFGACYDVCHKYGPDHQAMTSVARHAMMDLVGDGDNWKSHMEYTITCPDSKYNYDACGACRTAGDQIADTVGLIIPIFGFFGKLAVKGACASSCFSWA